MEDKIKDFIERKKIEAKKEQQEYRERIFRTAGLYEKIFISDMSPDEKISIDSSKIHTAFDTEGEDLVKQYIYRYPDLSDEEFKIIDTLVAEKDGKTEQIYNQLWYTSAQCQKYGGLCALITIALGFSFSIFANTEHFESADFFGTLVFWCILAAIEFFSFRFMSVFAGALASIVENTKKPSNN